MSADVLPTPGNPIAAPQPVAAPSWSKRQSGGFAFDAAMGREHRKPDIESVADEHEAVSMAQRLRSVVPTWAGIDAGLERARGLLATTLTGLHGAADTLVGRRRTGAEGAAMLARVRTCFMDARYGGKTLLSDFAGASTGFGSFAVAADAHGRTLSIRGYGTSSVYRRLEAAMAGSAERQDGEIEDVVHGIREWIKAVEANMDDVTHQITQNSHVIDRLSEGLGPLIDVDLVAEAARLKALQVQQQLRTTEGSVGNGTPSTLQALFK